MPQAHHTGRSGMVLTDDSVLAGNSRSHRNLCFQSRKAFLPYGVGQQLPIDQPPSRPGLAQMERMNEIIRKKRWIGKALFRAASGIPESNFR